MTPLKEIEDALRGACRKLDLSPERSACVQALAHCKALRESVPVALGETINRGSTDDDIWDAARALHKFVGEK